MSNRIPVIQPIISALINLSFAATASLIIAACATAPSHHKAEKSAERAAILTLPATEIVVLKLNAEGTQNYRCQALQNAPGQYEWVFVAPEAQLFDISGNLVGKHYAGPTWESLIDHSKVVGMVQASAPSPDKHAIPWLLLNAMPNADIGLFSQVKSIQRLDTHGGQPPTNGCNQATVNTVIKVPYTARYYFSRPKF